MSCHHLRLSEITCWCPPAPPEKEKKQLFQKVLSRKHFFQIHSMWHSGWRFSVWNDTLPYFWQQKREDECRRNVEVEGRRYVIGRVCTHLSQQTSRPFQGLSIRQTASSRYGPPPIWPGRYGPWSSLYGPAGRSIWPSHYGPGITIVGYYIRGPNCSFFLRIPM